MIASIADVESHLQAGDLIKAWDAFDMLRPNVRYGLEGLKISTRIHFAAKRWPQVDVLCRVLRKEHPTDISGFTHGAESLYEQGRIGEAIDLLKQWQTLAGDSSVLGEIERYQAALSSGAKQVA